MARKDRSANSESLQGSERANGYSLSRIARNGEDVITLSIAWEVDIANAGSFVDEVRSLIEDAGEQVILDLQNCRFIDSTGIRALIVLAQEQQAQGRRLELWGVAGEPRPTLGLTDLLDSGLFPRVADSGQRIVRAPTGTKTAPLLAG